ncbi:hypothetical protein CAPTEDRAFT_220918 [Capitella teleta]|uniref:Apple domain-containing protein n=1 Tax=Capitella teleta TaxID=283909 RepID=R7TRJ0_CAPTE|nr:hypothetical protein CAPTEDRAFT_220918 [Capitella teleta]|eukprot:ELT93645.1 hypothetical protein CAPTEDRAFT_220918 [Capitella teleta]
MTVNGSEIFLTIDFRSVDVIELPAELLPAELDLDIPEGYAAYPGISVGGGGEQSGAFNGDECSLACVNETTCVAFDFTYGNDGNGNSVGRCWFHEVATKCDTITDNPISYHMTELPFCTTDDWTTKTAAGTNPSS